MSDQSAGVTTEELLQQLLEEQKKHREDVAALRAEVAQSRAPVRNAAEVTALSQEELHALRMAEVAEHSHYCPACGKLADYPQQCVGRAEAPHGPTEVVPTTELTEGDSSHHTPAPHVTGEGVLVP